MEQILIQSEKLLISFEDEYYNIEYDDFIKLKRKINNVYGVPTEYNVMVVFNHEMEFYFRRFKTEKDSITFIMELENLNVAPIFIFDTYSLKNCENKVESKIEHRYCSEIDNMYISFTKITPGDITDSDNITDNIIADYDKDGKILGLEILSASHVLPSSLTNIS